MKASLSKLFFHRNPNISIEKTEKDHLNTKERRNSRSLRSNEKETLQCRANSVKRAIYNVVEHSEPGRPKRYQRKLSITPFEALKIPTTTSSDSTPCSSPIPIPPINIISPTMETSRLTCISPLPDTRRDSVDENFFNSINIPVPRQFADSRRSSGVPEVIQELEENGNGGEPTYRITRLSLSGGANIDDAGNALISPTGSEDVAANSLNANSPTERKLDFLAVPIVTGEHIIDPLSDYRPIEVFERNYYMSRELNRERQQNEDIKTDNDKQQLKKEEKENEKEMCQVDLIPPAPNVYISESMTIIDTDVAVVIVCCFIYE